LFWLIANQEEFAAIALFCWTAGISVGRPNRLIRKDAKTSIASPGTKTASRGLS
jgi:hypothetical protein